MLTLLSPLAIFILSAGQISSAQTVAPPPSASTPVVRQHTAEDEVASNLQSVRLSAGLAKLRQVPASDSEIQLTCTAAQTNQQIHDPELGNLYIYLTNDLASQTESLKLVALGTSQFPDGGPRRPVYSEKNWPRYSVVVFIDQSSKPGHTVYRVGVARRPSAFTQFLTPISGDNPIKDAKEWKEQVFPACRHTK